MANDLKIRWNSQPMPMPISTQASRASAVPTGTLLTLVALLLTCTLGSCVNTPRHGRKGLMHSAQRVLAMDLGKRTASERLRRLQRLPAVLASESRRTRNLRNDLITRQPIRSELSRAGAVPRLLTKGVADEARRRPKLPAGLWPSRVEFAQNTANNLDQLLQLLGPSRRPLNESSDRSHRTDHRDQRPERTLWQRLRRRLQL